MLQLLSLWFIVIFSAVLIISIKTNRIWLLKKNYAFLYLDWLFVPFNFLIPYSLVFSWKLFFVFLVVSTIVVIFLHNKWHQLKEVPNEMKYFVSDKGITLEGKLHFVFMTIETAIVLTALFSRATTHYYVFMMLCLLIYLISYLLIVRFVRHMKLRSKPELPFLLLGLISLFVRISIYILLKN